MQVVDERKANGINDVVGREVAEKNNNRSRYELGRDVLAEISGTPADTPKTGYAVFAPTIERFLKEHLFADLFERDLLSYRERELATVSILAGVGGVEPMFRSHATICLHLGVTAEQLSALLNIVEMNLGSTYSEPLRGVLNQITEKQWKKNNFIGTVADKCGNSRSTEYNDCQTRTFFGRWANHTKIGGI